ncbi:MAG: phosphotransferase [Actinobacteria bacterium]|nr:phosphotransferase [Actinomycetota bacterium]
MSLATTLPEEALLDFVTAQRWFGGKARDPNGLHVLDEAELRDGLADVLAEVVFSAGTHEIYQLLVGVRDGEWYDAFEDPATSRELIQLVRSGATIPSNEGTLEFHTLGALAPHGTENMVVRALGLEQSNSSVVLDDELIVKAYRRIEAGPNPELEMLAFLTSHGFGNVADLHGWWSYSGPLMDATLGIVQRYLPDAVDGWALAQRDPDALATRLRRLGEVIGTMHLVLASEPSDPAFCPEEPSAEALGLLTATIDEEIDQVFAQLPDVEAVAPIAGRGDEVRGLLRDNTHFGTLGKLIRTHGDLHLAQALWTEGDWVVVDFEGEPARSLPERRRKRSPLRDVAGMLRSFSYAASAVEGAPPGFEAHAREEFLAAYRLAVQAAGILPEGEQAIDRLLKVFELEKAVYELRYELNNRPDWVHVPVGAILQLMEPE